MSRFSHISEWMSSGVDTDIISLNTEPLHGTVAFERLYGHAVKRLQTGGNPLNSFWMRRYREFENVDGWWVCGLDPLNNFQRSDWGRYKPTTGQIYDKQKGKPAKYLSPAKKESHPIFLDVPRHIWDKVASRYRVKVGDYQGNFWQWVLSTPSIPIYITEGEKKAGSLLTAGYAAISIPGVWMGTRRKLAGKHSLVPDLALFDIPGRQVHIIFDHETDFKKARMISRAAETLAWAFKRSQLFIGRLPGPAKGVDDFLVADGDFAAVPFDSLAHIRCERLWGLNYKPNIELNQRYLGDLPGLPASGLVCVKSPKGTGKTTMLEPIVSAAIRRGQRVLIISPRIALGRALCDKLGLPWVTDSRSFYVDAQTGQSFKDGRFAGFGICYDSLHSDGQGRIQPTEWAGALVILDEFEGGLWHLLNSSTIRNRVKVLETFNTLISLALDTGGAVYALDADLSDLSVKYLHGLADVQPFVVVNRWRSVPWEVTLFDDDGPSALLNEAIELVNNDGKIWLATDTQKAKSNCGSKNVESLFLRRCPGKRVLRFDSVTLADPNHPAYGALTNINQVVLDYDVIIASPSITSGVSVDVVGHFAAVFGIFQGVGVGSDALQALARVRETVPRYVWCAEYGVGSVGCGSCSPKDLIAFSQKETRINIQLLATVFDMHTQGDSSLATWARLAARVNCASTRFREWVNNRLLSEGHKVTIANQSQVDEIMSAIKEIKEENTQADAVAVAQSPDITDVQFEALSKKQTKTLSEQQSERKHSISKQYRVNVTPELVILNATRGWRSGLQLHYYLTSGKNFLKTRDRNELRGHLERGAGRVCLQDLRLLGCRVATIERLGVFDFLDGSEFTKHDDRVQSFARLCLGLASDLRAMFGITISDDIVARQPVRVVQKFLKLLGLKLQCKQRRRPGSGEREYVYWFAGDSYHQEPAGLRDAIFAAWLARDAASHSDEVEAA